MIRAVLFDFGGTLVSCPEWMDLELAHLISAVLAELRCQGWRGGEGADQERGRQLLQILRQRARDTWQEYSAHRCVQEIFPRIGAELPPAALLDAALARIYRRLLPRVRWLPGSLSLLRALRDACLRLGLVSNAAYSPFLLWALERAGARGLFGAVVISARTGWRKPHPRPFLEALTALGVSAAEACHVGDHWEQDVVGATRAGLKAIWVGGDQELPVRPWAVACHLGEVASLLLGEDGRYPCQVGGGPHGG